MSPWPPPNRSASARGLPARPEPPPSTVAASSHIAPEPVTSPSAATSSTPPTPAASANKGKASSISKEAQSTSAPPAAAGGMDSTHLWLNPYGGSGSGINLDGGTLSTARPIANGTGGVPAFLNFNGGTLLRRRLHVGRRPGTVDHQRSQRRRHDRHQWLQPDRDAGLGPFDYRRRQRDRRRPDEDRRGHPDDRHRQRYTGDTNVNAGTLKLNKPINGASGTIRINNGGTLTFGGNDTWGNDSTTSSAGDRREPRRDAGIRRLLQHALESEA